MEVPSKTPGRTGPGVARRTTVVVGHNDWTVPAKGSGDRQGSEGNPICAW